MKTKLILFILLFLNITIQPFSQDAYTTIGRIKLRYDADSNKLRLGYNGTAVGLGLLRFAKEFDAQLFDFNTQHFTWTNGKLNLNTIILTEDSISTNKLTLKKDTTWVQLGENVSKWRTLTFSKSLYTNSPLNVPDWKLDYESRNESGVLIGGGNYYLLNDIVTWQKSLNVTLNSSGVLIDSDMIFPVPNGRWFVTGEADVEFDFMLNVAGDVYDSIWVVFGNGTDGSIPEVELARTVIKCGYPNGIYSGMQSRITFSCVVNDPGLLPQNNFTLYAYSSNSAYGDFVNIPRRIRSFKINAQLIH
jgi:hypothetical protein